MLRNEPHPEGDSGWSILSAYKRNDEGRFYKIDDTI